MTPWELAGLTLAEWVTLPLVARALHCVDEYAGWEWSNTPVAAFDAPGLPRGLVVVNGRQTDCVLLAAPVVMATLPLAGWTPADYADLAVWAPRGDVRRWSASEALERRGCRLVDVPVVGSVHHVQLWWGTKGHQVIAIGLPDGRVWVHDASRSAGVVRARVMAWDVLADGCSEVYAVELVEAT